MIMTKTLNLAATIAFICSLATFLGALMTLKPNPPGMSYRALKGNGGVIALPFSR